MEVLISDQYATRNDNIKDMERNEKKKAKMINDFKKEKSSYLFICKKCCRRTMTKLNPFRKSKFEIKITFFGVEL